MAVNDRYNSGLSASENARIGKLLTPLKMYIIEQSDLAAKKSGAAKWICGDEQKSNRFAETGVTELRDSGMMPVEEGGVADLKGTKEGGKVVIEHYEYATREAITWAQMEDANFRINQNMQRQMRKIVNDYWTTKNNLATLMISGGCKGTATYKGKTINLPAPDDILFKKDHKYGTDGDTQSNLFYNTRAANTDIDYSMCEDIILNVNNKLRTMKTNTNDVSGYTADVIFIPGNTPKLEKAMRKVCGSVLSDTGSGASNGINTVNGNFQLCVLPNWIVSSSALCPMVFVSTDARDNLGGFQMFNRANLNVKARIDEDTFNTVFNARTRLGIGNFSYIHAVYFESIANGTTTLADGQTASSVGTSITL